jgi:hypothetical protein
MCWGGEGSYNIYEWAMAEPKSLHSCVTCLHVYLRSMSTLYEIMHNEAKFFFFFFLKILEIQAK